MHVVVFAPECTGSHWVARSIARALRIPYAHGPLSVRPSRSGGLLMVTHEEWQPVIADKVFGLTRNPLDHLLSYMSFHRLSNAPKVAASNAFRFQRRISRSIPESYLFSYDDLLSNRSEVSRLIELLGLPESFVMEDADETRKNLPEFVRVARSGYWRDALTMDEAAIICATLGEPSPAIGKESDACD